MREQVLLSFLLFQAIYLTVADPSAVCPNINEAEVTFITDDKDCSIFYQCQWVVAYKYDCPAGLHFDPIINVCNYPELVNCEDSRHNDGDNSEETSVNLKESNENNSINNSENNDGDGNAVSDCPEVDGEYVTLLPHSSNCSKFFICNQGTPVLAECPGNLLFNPNLLVCDYAENAGCLEDSNNGDSGTDDGNVVNGSKEQNNEYSAECGTAVGECPQVDGEYVTLLPHSSDCRKFFICHEGKPVLTECTNNLLFNPVFLVCDNPENAGCEEYSNNGDEGSVVDGTEEDQSNESNAADGNAVGECPKVDGEYVTLLPHSSDCSKFFICNNGTPVLTECPGNLLFNPNLLVCDYSESAGCQS